MEISPTLDLENSPGYPDDVPLSIEDLNIWNFLQEERPCGYTTEFFQSHHGGLQKRLSMIRTPYNRPAVIT